MPFIKIPGFVEHAGQTREKETEKKKGYWTKLLYLMLCKSTALSFSSSLSPSLSLSLFLPGSKLTGKREVESTGGGQEMARD